MKFCHLLQWWDSTKEKDNGLPLVTMWPRSRKSISATELIQGITVPRTADACLTRAETESSTRTHCAGSPSQVTIYNVRLGPK
jgi:hypothetical protein